MSEARGFPAFGVQRRSTRGRSWWARAWVQALEDTSLDSDQLRKGRRYANSGQVGTITISPGRIAATVYSPEDTYEAVVEVDELTGDAWSRFLDQVAERAGHIAALLDGDMPHDLVEAAADAGVPLLPGIGDLDSSCTCDGWELPCRHAAALCYQVAWLLDADPFVLLLLRGRSREDLLDELQTRSSRAAASLARGYAADPGTAEPSSTAGPGSTADPGTARPGTADSGTSEPSSTAGPGTGRPGTAEPSSTADPGPTADPATAIPGSPADPRSAADPGSAAGRASSGRLGPPGELGVRLEVVLAKPVGVLPDLPELPAKVTIDELAVSGIEPPPGFGPATLPLLVLDASRRARATLGALLHGAPEPQPLDEWADAVRLAADFPELMPPLAEATDRPEELALGIQAWRYGGPAGLEVLEHSWTPDPAELARARTELLAADEDLAIHADANHLTLGDDTQVRLDRQGRWHPYRLIDGTWTPAAPPSPDPLAALATDS